MRIVNRNFILLPKLQLCYQHHSYQILSCFQYCLLPILCTKQLGMQFRHENCINYGGQHCNKGRTRKALTKVQIRQEHNYGQTYSKYSSIVWNSELITFNNQIEHIQKYFINFILRINAGQYHTYIYSLRYAHQLIKS